ncbi:HsmA family protein [Paenibacillus sp. GCM10027628]|uniref:HsmA family protein n=1 Tax=Paenibacillus sp. GCM10027628 TaxID=3273413 RepID=UPI0036288233
MLPYAIIFMTSALIFYTIGVWSEKIQGILKGWHIVIFWIGLICDSAGTTLMSKIAKGGFAFNFHGITGLLALWLMLFHVIWATIVLIRKNKTMLVKFHKFSLIVWILWLIPYISGLIYGMMG